MAKVSGLTSTVTVGGNDISGDITSFSVNTPTGVQDVTGIDKSAMERLLLRADCSGSFSGVANTTAGMSHATLNTPASQSVVIVFPGPATLTFNAVFTDYNMNFGTDGSWTWSASFALDSGTAAAWT